MEKQFFIIAGLPRCRTTWLSQLFTFGPVFCWHDLSAECMTVDEIATVMRNTPGSYVGISDSCASIFLDELEDKLPGCKIAFVDRPVHESIYSLAKAAGIKPERVSKVIEDMSERLAAQEIVGPIVRFEDLDRHLTILRLWNHLVPDFEFPEIHYNQIKNLKIEVHPSLLRQAAREGKDCIVSRFYAKH